MAFAELRKDWEPLDFPNCMSPGRNPVQTRQLSVEMLILNVSNKQAVWSFQLANNSNFSFCAGGFVVVQ